MRAPRIVARAERDLVQAAESRHEGRNREQSNRGQKSGVIAINTFDLRPAS